jgi:hypothetical protein
LITLALPRRSLGEGGSARLQAKNFQKTFPSPAHLSNLLPKIPVIRQEKNYKKM